ncbi:MAG TPA: DUF1549 domain-containing protein, partial [Vicinamibacterales bacterium]|nr:DUF1549 domain-containing protein [Vicinamibacterales bacterium]
MIPRCTLRSAGWLIAAAMPLAVQIAGEARQSPASSVAQTAEFFEANIRPVLAANCYDCHTEEQLGGLRLDSRDGLLKGGKSGPAIVPGEPDRSLMIQAVRQSGALKMPKGGRLKPEEVDALIEWVRAGAVWPTFAATAASVGKPESAASAGTSAPATQPTASVKPTAPAYMIKPEQRAFWSFQPIHTSAVPEVKRSDWAKTDIDRFVLARLEQEGLTPVPAADKRMLIRRATLDLIGLPPTVEEIEAFEHDDSPEAFAHVIDRLLASPQYGEAWGRLWLDVARYGEDDY